MNIFVKTMLLSILTMAILTKQATAQTFTQKVGVPAYFYPGSEWNRMDDGVPTVGFAIANPSSGPGTSYNNDYGQQIITAQNNGLAVIGYVYTSYMNRNIVLIKKDIDR